MAYVYDFQAIRAQTQKVMREPTPPSREQAVRELERALRWYHAYGQRRNKPEPPNAA